MNCNGVHTYPPPLSSLAPLTLCGSIFDCLSICSLFAPRLLRRLNLLSCSLLLRTIMSAGSKSINLSIAIAVIDTLAVGLRLLARSKTKAPFAIDDYFIVGSLVPLYGMIAAGTLRMLLE